MNKLKRIFGFVIPFAIIIAICFGVVLPLAINEERKLDTRNFLADESGASSANKSQKGGAIYLEEGATYIMTGGTIENHKNIYGGAVYVSNKATFTMNGGTIKNCRAMYGGAIYIENGGKVIINGGNILNNTAEKGGPAIYVEEGGNLTIDGTSVVDGNIVDYYVPLYVMGEEETMGGTYDGVLSTVKLRTMYFGSYPQTYVGDDLNDQLENWYSGKKVVKTYTIRDSQVWDAYEYTDGQLYARGSSYRYSSGSSYTYKNGTTVKATGTAVWFKVEPIKWYILNYDAWQSGTENIELLSELALTSYIRFNPTTSAGNNWKGSELQTWLRDEFYETAFDENEREIIALTKNKNGITKEYNSAPSSWTGESTEDYVYCKTYYEMGHDMFAEDFNVGNGYASRICSPTDFALSNYCYMYTSYTTNYRTGTCNWWLRSAGWTAYNACDVDNLGGLSRISVDYGNGGVRPALHLSI